MRKKYKWPRRMPISSMTPPPEMITLKAKRTQGRYIALNCDPNQKLTMTSLFNWHQMYKTASTRGSMRNMMFMKRPMITAQIQMNINMNA